MDLLFLVNKVSMLSKADREAILKKQNLPQPRCLRIRINDTISIKPRQLNFCMKLATEYELVIACLTNDNHVYIVESILDKLTSE